MVIKIIIVSKYFLKTNNLFTMCRATFSSTLLQKYQTKKQKKTFNLK